MTRDYLLYLRKSKGRAGIPRQRNTTTAHIAAKLGGRIAAEFPDADRTAYQKPGSPRPERENFTAMLAAIRADTSDPPAGIAAWHADRLIRSGGDAEDLIDACAPGRHPVETPNGGSYELWTATGRKRLRDDATAAAYEVDHLTERVNEKKADKAMAGEWPGGFRPFGWDLVPAPPGSGRRYDGLVLNEREAAALREAARLILSGTTLYGVAASLNRQGIASSRGGQWRGRDVRDALLRPWNAGLAVYRGRETGTPTRWVPSEGDGEPAAGEPILDLEVFRALQVTLGGRRRPGEVTARKWPGTGVYLCGAPDGNGGYCDTPLHKHHVGSRGPVYAHEGHVARSAVRLDEYVSALVCGFLEKPGAAEILRPEPGTPDVATLHARIVSMREGMRRRAKMHALEQISDDQLIEATAEARAQIAALEARIAAAAAVSPLDGLAGAPDAAARWDALRENGDIGRQQAVIRHLMTVRVLPQGRGRPHGSPAREKFFRYDRIKITWRVPGRPAGE